MKAHWTGGQYSIYRFFFGVYLFVHFVRLLPWASEIFSSEGVLPTASMSPLAGEFPNVLTVADGPVVVTALLGLGAAASIFLAVGWFDRIAALSIWYLWACFFGRDPLIANPSIPYVGFLLLAHACLPPAPFLSMGARGRADPGGGWRMPGAIWIVAWIVLAAGYSYSGYAKLLTPSWTDGSAIERMLMSPPARPTFLLPPLLAFGPSFLAGLTYLTLALELGFLPLCSFARTRRFVWTAALTLQTASLFFMRYADLSFGMLLFHAFTFDPRWVPARRAKKPELLFYDGTCGVCHRTVRLILAEDEAGAFRFAPLGGKTFEKKVLAERRAGLPDSIVLLAADGGLEVRSDAVIHVFEALGGVWGLLAKLLRAFPKRTRDVMYDAFARIRHRLVKRPAEACPLMPNESRQRFDD